MKTLRAIGLGILGWILIFVEISIFKIGLNIPGLHQYLIHYILLIPITVLIAWIYYKSKDKLNGFVLGIVFSVIGIILDLAITIPLFLQVDYSGFYTDFYLWIGFIEMILVTGIYDIGRKK